MRVWTKNANSEIFEKILKIFDENSIEKLNFYFIFRKFVTKNRAFGNNTSFLQFFSVSGGGDFPFPPGYALACLVLINYLLSFLQCLYGYVFLCIPFWTIFSNEYEAPVVGFEKLNNFLIKLLKMLPLLTPFN